MNKIKIQTSDLLIHKTKRNALKRFLIVITIFIVYFLFVSFGYGISNGFMVSILTWTFFVFATPIADAGFLVDFPVRLFTKIRMIYSEIIVWIISALINTYFLLFSPQIYEKTSLLSIFKNVLTHPYPYWGIIILSMTGTFLSVYFGDELLDVTQHHERKKYITHKKKHRFILITFLFFVFFIIYTALVKNLGITL